MCRPDRISRAILAYRKALASPQKAAQIFRDRQGEPMRIDGHCHCGHVAYEAEIDPNEVSVCHCTDCQQLTGSPFRVTALAATENLRLTAAPPKVYRKYGDNGQARLQSFCPECGSPLFTTGEGEAAAITGIRWGSIVQRAALKPSRQIWCRSAAPWIGTVPGLPGREGD
jgi:hypothetical protein